MNIEELEKALRQINGNLISDKECQYLKFVSDYSGLLLTTQWNVRFLDSQNPGCSTHQPPNVQHHRRTL